MSKADCYRKKHKELMDKEQQEESLPMACLMTGVLTLGIAAWLGFFMMIVREL